MDKQVPIMTKTANNNHNFGSTEGFWQILTIQRFRRGQSPNFPPKRCFFSTRHNSKIYQLQEKPFCITEIKGP